MTEGTAVRGLGVSRLVVHVDQRMHEREHIARGVPFGQIAFLDGQRSFMPRWLPNFYVIPLRPHDDRVFVIPRQQRHRLEIGQRDAVHPHVPSGSIQL